ncbi:D-glycerate dehydrogenase [Brevibacillus agri]|uniref:2-hydroxyacid dehydrogenase n=1 Tax=Brevibacillus agri TaxID=51101 RepID=UPI0018CDD3C3|nr:D-glycerate dehydrogenase [Brevibacillus agri]MBG9567092.1 glyoxylate reductase [Brevibacillus agri]MBG9568392.1 glyoxylate reductase [Brevibacillus agri]MBG9568400.1 glyoxylate reductase [Brevibacillus agri]
MRPNVYITRRIPQSALEKISEVCNVEMWEEEDIPVPRAVLEEKIEEIDGLYCLLTENIDETLLNRAKKLKVVSNMAVGYNNIDVDAASRKGIMVTNTPGVLTETTADLTFVLLMTTARRIVEASDFLRNGNWKTWSPMLLTGQDVFGATIGIIGLGRIGESLAKRAKGFDMRVLYHNRSRKEEAEKTLGLEYVDFDTLLKESDFVCVMTPYTPETRNLIGERELSLMKSTAILINTARGGIVDEAALYKALKDGTIWAAGLDVFEEEPVKLNHPLLTLPNVVTLPHIGSASIKTRTLMAELAATNLIQAVTGQIPTHLVNKEVSNQ